MRTAQPGLGRVFAHHLHPFADQCCCGLEPYLGRVACFGIAPDQRRRRAASFAGLKQQLPSGDAAPLAGRSRKRR